MPRWSDILAQASAAFGHIIRKITASDGTAEMPNRPYLDFAGNCTVEDTGESIKVTVPDVPAGQVSVGQTRTIGAGERASVAQRGTPTNRILDFYIPTGPVGPIGPQGEAATIRVGTVESVEAGEQVDVQNVGDNHDAIFNFCLPKGDKGDTGEVYIDNTVTLTSDQDAYVENHGTSTTAHLEFGIPRGKSGTVTVGTVTPISAGSNPTVTQTGTPEDAVFNFSLPRSSTLSLGQTEVLPSNGTPSVSDVASGDSHQFIFSLPRSTTVTVGQTTTLSTGSNASVANSGTADDVVLSFGIPQGSQVSVGTVTTLPDTEDATVTNGGDATNVVLNFGIPHGKASTVTVGTTQTLQPGTDAYVTNSGTSGDAVLNFGIPAGDPYVGVAPIANGGTAATNVVDARTNLGVYSTTETDAAIDSAIQTLRNGLYVPVQTLPATGDAGKVYLVPDNLSETGNTYREYVFVNGGWELLGPRTIDLSGYSLKSETVTSFQVNGTTVTFSRADGTTGTFSTQDTTYSTATQQANGLMSAGDKAKLDGISANAKSVSVSPSLASGTVVGTITIDGTPYTLYCEPNTDTTYNDATQSVHGLMSTADKVKLDGIQASADAVSFTQSLTSGTAVGTLTINGTPYTLYCQTNSDTLVAQGVSSTNEERPVLFKTSTATTATTAQISFTAAGTTVNPNTGVISAPTFFGKPIVLSGNDLVVSAGSIFTKTISANTAFTFSGVVSGKSACFSLILTDGGDYTITWPSSVKWADGEVPSLTSGGTDVLVFLTKDGGATWYGTLSVAAVA